MDSTLNSSPRGRPRSEAKRQIIYQTALAIIAERGYKALTMEGIAQKAGVGKQTVYRWWSSPADIGLEALLADAQEIDQPQTKDALLNLDTWLQGICRLLSGPHGTVLRGLMAEAQLDKPFAQQFWDSFITQRRAVLIVHLHRAQHASLVSPAADLDFLADIIFGAIWYRLLTGRPTDDGYARQLARYVID